MVTTWVSPASQRRAVCAQRCHTRRKWATSSACIFGLVKGQPVLPSRVGRGHLYMPPAVRWRGLGQLLLPASSWGLQLCVPFVLWSVCCPVLT